MLVHLNTVKGTEGSFAHGLDLKYLPMPKPLLNFSLQELFAV